MMELGAKRNEASPTLADPALKKLFEGAEFRSFFSLEPLFLALILSDLLAPFFIWPHWTGQFYSGWAIFFSSGLSHWLQALALVLSWPVLRDKMWGRLCLTLIAGLHVFLPPPSLANQLFSSLAAAAGWWLALLPGALAVSRKQPEGSKPPAKPLYSRDFQLIVWLALAANLLLILVLLWPALIASEPGWPPSETLLAALEEIAIFLAFLAVILFAGRGDQIFSVPVYLAALISLGGILWLWPGAGLTESSLEAFLIGLVAIHLTLLPILGALIVVIILAVLFLRRRFTGFGSCPVLIKSGLILALALTPIAGLGLAAIPVWADHLSRSYLNQPPASESHTLLAAGPLVLPVPVSLKLTDWAIFIHWVNHEETSPAADDNGRPLRASQRGKQDRAGYRWDDHGLILLETEYGNPSLARQEFDEAWQNRLRRGPERTGFPKSMEDLSDQFGRPSRLLIHYNQPRHAESKGAMVMRLTFYQQHFGGYLSLMEARPFETENLDPAELEGLKAKMKAEFLERVGMTVAAYNWGRVEPGAAVASYFMTRCGRLDQSRLAADLEAKFRLARIGDQTGWGGRSRDGTDIWIWSRQITALSDGSPAVTGSQSRPTAEDPQAGRASAKGSARLEPLLGWVDADRPRVAADGRSGWEDIRITVGSWPSSPASLSAIWSSADGGLEVEIRSDRRLVQAELPALTWLWSELLGGAASGWQPD